MSFNIALSGIAAAQKDLDTTANNIANVNTTGFKESRAEFADVYATSIFSSARTKVGDGVTTALIAQQFHQGSLQFTNNSLDLAITGEGFFAMSSDREIQDLTYTRAGAFKLNKDNYITDSRGNYLQGYRVNPETGEPTSVTTNTVGPIAIPANAGAPRASTNWFLTLNLDSRATAIDGATVPFDPDNDATFHYLTDTTVYDSLGEPHVMTSYFRKIETVATTPPTTQWEVYNRFDGEELNPAPPVTTLTFDASGNLVAIPTITLPAGTTIPPTGLNGLLTNGAVFPDDFTIQFTDPAGIRHPTQLASTSEVFVTNSDGTSVGALTDIEINHEGKIVASYSNGDKVYLAQVAIVRFANVQGLKQVGNTSWKETINSGAPIAGQANHGTFGAIESSALEQSNVNLTTELVDLITAQRNFQANSRALEVNSTLQQTVLQIR
ncbi:flagellar hook protein FlgE [Chromatiaceae bacterium AAb-1]|nr:flagellar hook protein FlgE [Chromatiaceae bacterium AAb-1]